MKRTIRLLACLTACLCAGGCADIYVVAEAEYPVMASRPRQEAFTAPDGTWDYEAYEAQWRIWQAERESRQNQPAGYTDGVSGFTARAAEAFMTDREGETRIISPLNLYITLSMLAETTDGTSRAQLLEALEADSLDTVRSRADCLWTANTCDDGALTSVLASSLWLDQDIAYAQETVDRLAKTYHASTYQGQMEDPGYTRAFRQWLNEQTGGLRSDAAEELAFADETVMALASTVDYRGRWGFEFSEENTEKRVFHAPAGDVTADFMVQSDDGQLYISESFTAIYRSIEAGGEMWLFLPAEGVTPEQVLLGEEMYRLAADCASWENQEHVVIHQYIPKFDAASTLELEEGLTAMGITDLWDAGTADFSPIAPGMEGLLALAQASHSVRVAVDEEGITAAAFTVVMADAECAPPEKEVDFVLDRPFVFLITGTDNVPLFLGKVCTP